MPDEPKNLSPHDEATAELHAAAKKLGVTPAWLVQERERQNRLKEDAEKKHTPTTEG